MDIPKIKELVQKFSFFKNSSLLVPVIIGLIAVVLLVIESFLGSKLQENIRVNSIWMGNQLKSLLDDAVASEQLKVERERQSAYVRDANQVALLAKQSTQRQLLSYKIFPEPTDTSTLIFREFGQRYVSGLDEFMTILNAGERPTDIELQQGLEKASGRLYRGGRLSSRGPSLRYSLSYMRKGDIAYTIVDEICRGKAESISIYANPIDIGGYEYWGQYKYDVGIKEAIEDCWYYQLAYWVIEDIIDTIKAMNGSSDNVLTAPVKRLLGVHFTLEAMGSTRARQYGRVRTFRLGVSRRQRGGDQPSYVYSLNDGLTEPCTGRICNDDIDVIHFNVVVIVSAKAVLPFMKELCSVKQHRFTGWDNNEPLQVFKHNQITVLESKIVSVDQRDPIHRFYHYGEDAVVELDLICEYIFNKKGYDEIKPVSIKEAIKGTGETPTPGR